MTLWLRPHALLEVDEFHGFPNKNTGEAFLVVWKIRPDETKENDLHTEDKDGCPFECACIRQVKVAIHVSSDQLAASYSVKSLRVAPRSAEVLVGHNPEIG